LFRVSTLDLANLPRTPEGKVDFAQDFFGREAFLTVSGQLNVEAYCLALTKVYTFGPTFRAENSNTSRHLAEFWMIEPEIAFADLSDNAALAEALLKYTFAALLNEKQEDLAFFDQRIEKGLVAKLEGIVGSEFVHMDYGEAIEVLERANEKFEFPVKWGIDLQSEHERYLTEKHTKKPVIVMNYPKDIKAFYMRVNDDGRTVAAMDVLAPGIGQIIGGSQREERSTCWTSATSTASTVPPPYPPPRAGVGRVGDLRRYGTVPHAGFGLGFERTLAYVTGRSNVRDALLPRTPGNRRYCGIDDHAIVIIALYVDGSGRVRNHRIESATPDLDLIKQAEQGARDRRGRFAKSRSGNPADGRRITPVQSPRQTCRMTRSARRSAGR
jgi:asparaginyl-tRNA synthetase